MKKIILLFVLFCSLALAQGWKSIVTTSINEPNLDRMDLFTNKDGNHILIKRTNGTIIYYNINSSGTVNSNKTETLESNGDFPNIVGSNEKIYAIYKSGNYIKGKYSTNGGTDWSPVLNQSTTSNTCNGVDVVYEIDRGTHVVWATKDSYPYYETHYCRLNLSDSWVDYKNVTDYGNEVGGFPTVTTSTNRVHVSYNTGTSSDPVYNQGNAKTRDKYQSTWQIPQLVFGSGDGNSGSERSFSDNSSLFVFYYKFITDMGGWHFDLYVKERTVGGTSWSSPTLIEYHAHPGHLVSTLKTNDGKTNIFYEAGYPATIYHKSYDGENWSDGYSVATISSGYFKAHSSSVTSNDLFVIYKESTSNNVKYRQYDAVPLAPQNLQISVPSGHPVLTWKANSEPDLSHYLVDRSEDGYNWDNGIAQVYTNSFTDRHVFYNSVFEDEVYYKVRAVDRGSHISNSSNTVYLNDVVIKKQNLSAAHFDYRLNAAYPNPFNPTAKISYSVQREGLVTIKVFDVLGKEVAELVNEMKPEGFYEVEFNASNLPSGIYIYKMQSGKFTAVNKMILLR